MEYQKVIDCDMFLLQSGSKIELSLCMEIKISFNAIIFARRQGIAMEVL